MVLARDMSLRSLAFGLGPSVKVDDLARAMIRLAMNAANDVERNIWENTDINKGL
jgi:FlaA1/EpsC-like NDP-sugar epimerase